MVSWELDIMGTSSSGVTERLSRTEVEASVCADDELIAAEASCLGTTGICTEVLIWSVESSKSSSCRDPGGQETAREIWN